MSPIAEDKRGVQGLAGPAALVVGVIVVADSETKLGRVVEIPAVVSCASRSEPCPPTSCLWADQVAVAEQAVSRAAALASAVR